MVVEERPNASRWTTPIRHLDQLRGGITFGFGVYGSVAGVTLRGSSSMERSARATKMAAIGGALVVALGILADVSGLWNFVMGSSIADLHASPQPSQPVAPYLEPTYKNVEPTRRPKTTPPAEDVADDPDPTSEAPEKPRDYKTLAPLPAVEKPRPVRVPLADLCNVEGSHSYICGRNFGEELRVGDQLFTYYAQGNGNAIVRPPNWGDLVGVPENTCTRINLQFTVRSIGGDPTTGTLRVVQTGMAAQQATADFGEIGELSAKLNGGPFLLEYTSTNGNPVVADGYATCLSASGV